MPHNSSASLPLTLSTAFMHPLAEVLGLVAVAKFPGLVDAGAGPAGDRRAAEGAIGQLDVDFDGGVSAAIEDLPGVDVNNG